MAEQERQQTDSQSMEGIDINSDENIPGTSHLSDTLAEDGEAEKLKNEIDSLMSENMNLKEQVKKKDEEKTDMARKLKEGKFELMKMREEMEAQTTYTRDMLAEKDEEKREVIRQLSLGMEMLRQENKLLKKSIMKSAHAPKKQGSFEFPIFKGFGLGNLFGLSPKCPTSVVPL